VHVDHEHAAASLYEADPESTTDQLKPAYTAPKVWEEVDPLTTTLCSPDPQAIRPADEKADVLQVKSHASFSRRGTKSSGG
jgi:hypothetical protein